MQPQVTPFLHEDTGTWSYVVSDPAGGDAAIIDPVLDFDPKSGRVSTHSIERVLSHVRQQQLSVSWILETHAHADHLSAGDWLRRQMPAARLGIGEGIRTVQRTFRGIYNFGDELPVDGSQFDHLFTEDERFRIGSFAGRVIPVPGHTGDAVAYLIGDALFTGDSLFMPDAGSARCDFPGGDAGRLFDSIQRLFALPDETRVFVCHDYGPGGRETRCETTIAAQKAGNIHVRSGTRREEFVQLRETRDATLAMPTLILPAIQVNIRAGAFPVPEDNGVRYLKLPVDQF